MRNLELLQLIHKSVDLRNVDIIAQASDLTYFIRNNCLYKHDFASNQIAELCPQTFENVQFLQILPIENKICIVCTCEIHIFDPDKEIQTLFFEHEISAIKWNPTEELVVIVSENDVYTYSIDYVNCEKYLQGKSSTLAKIPDTVYVGWGSKDTQFRGSEGKLKNQAPVETKPVFDKKPTISWRGNGEMFVVNFWRNNARFFVVFEAPCAPMFKSEECPGLQAPIAWRPAGNMIAGLASTHQKSLTIFEKNGQKRFDFPLDCDQVHDLKWSPCAQILTIVTNQSLHLLTSSNYKWYRKQTLCFHDDNPMLAFDWLESNQFSFVLRVATRKQIVKYTFRSTINQSSGICAVIDGACVQLTNFNTATVPPIMFSEKIDNHRPVNFVSLSKNRLITVDCDNHLSVFDTEGNQVGEANLTSHIDVPLNCHHFILTDDLYFTSDMTYNLNLETNQLTAVNSEPIDVDCVCQDTKTIADVTYKCQLMSNCHFYVNDSKLSDCVNSFLIFDTYLLYTTKQNQLYCLRLGELDRGLFYRRSIEQGATLVTAVQNSPKIVLQMPRGNLETISCRLISIDILDSLLDDQRWLDAVRFIRLEKLNANLLFDLNSDRFLQNVDKFIGSVSINELNGMVVEFEQGNVLTTLYQNWGKCQNVANKLDLIFTAILTHFDTKLDYCQYISTIMIINLNFLTLKQALVYLQDLLRRNCRQKLIDAVNTLKMYGCDQEKLYNESLALYDLDLAQFVATCCQLDPRIYQPHIKQLKTLTEVERRFEINAFVKNHKMAVAYLIRCPNVKSDAIVTFIREHQVGRAAYENCPRQSRHFSLVSGCYGRDLSGRGCHYEAGLVFKKAGLIKEAVEEFKLSLNWKEVLDLLQVEGVEKVTLVNELGQRLVQHSKVKEAAVLYEFYAGNYEMALKVLLDNYCFEDAIHIARKHNRDDVIVSEVVPLLLKHKAYLTDKVRELGELFQRYKTRLAAVRCTRIEKMHNYDDDRDDLFSEVGSTITRSSRSSRSRSSTASSRNRRKEEKKKQDLREGGVYEDIALIRALYLTIKEIYSKSEEVRTCCCLLLQESDVSFKDIEKFQDFYAKTVSDVRSGISEIWPAHFYANNPTQNLGEMADLENLQFLDVEYRAPPAGYKEWNLGFF